MLVKISPTPARYEGGFMSIILSALIEAQSKAETVEARNVAELAAHVERIKATLPANPMPGSNLNANGWYISILPVRGQRKFAGFDAWESANQRFLKVQPDALRATLADIAVAGAGGTAQG